MALLTESIVREAAATELRKSYQASARTILKEIASTARTSFDIFLSHARLDAELVLGVRNILVNSGKTVYVDWIDDPQLDRNHVTAATANALRKRMGQCESLFYVHSNHATQSRWMPWELGYFDGRNGNVAIVPVLTGGQSTFRGEEFLGLYSYVDVLHPGGPGASLWLHRSASDYTRYEDWRRAADKKRP